MYVCKSCSHFQGYLQEIPVLLPASGIMAMPIPHDVFKHILSFKDPTKQVGVKGGIKAPSCVWYTWKQRHSAPTGAIIRKRSVDVVRTFKKVTSEWQDHFAPEGFERGKVFSLWKTSSRYWLNDNYDRNPWDSEADETCPTRIGELSEQCEPCGPDLELYHIISG